MGARYDNGGLYVPPARSFGRIIVEISMDDGDYVKDFQILSYRLNTKTEFFLPEPRWLACKSKGHSLYQSRIRGLS